jgi:hypothetical protein
VRAGRVLAGPAAGRARLLAGGHGQAPPGGVRARGTAVLEVEPLGKLSGAARAAVEREGMRLLEFAAADAGDRDVRFAAAG